MKSMNPCMAVQTLSELSRLDRVKVLSGVLSAGGAQHTARRGRGGRRTVVRVVIIGWGAGEDGVSIG